MKRRSSNWVVASTIGETWQKFWKEAGQLPGAAEWAKVMALGLGIFSLMTLGLTKLGQTVFNGPLQAWDEAMLLPITQALPFTFAKAVTLESPGNMAYLIPLVICAVMFAVWRSRPLMAASIAAAYLLQYALVWIGWGVWNRARPDLIADGLAAPGLHSFPSGHATVITATFGFLFYLWARSSRNSLEQILAFVLFVAWTVITSMGRLALGAHWPSDIFAGWIIGGSWALTMIVAFERGAAIARRQQKL